MMIGQTGNISDLEPGSGNLKYAKGMIVNLSEDDSSGCGWVVEIDKKYFKPKNLSKAFHKDSLHVNLDYDLSLTMFHCPDTEEHLQEIMINWMEKEK